MAKKKAFTDSPAMNFITQGEEATPAKEEAPKKTKDTPKERPVKVEILKEEEEAPKEIKVSIAKEPGKAPRKKKGFTIVYVDGKPVQIENKSQRVQLLITPSLHTRLKKTAKAEGLSVNELINIAITEYIEK